MLVAVCDQPFGTSTSSWRKIVTPFSLPISAERFSHSTRSNGEIFPSVKNRSNTSPVRTPAAVSAAAFVSSVFPFSACFTVAILFLHIQGPRLGRNPFILLLRAPRRTPASKCLLPASNPSESGLRRSRPLRNGTRPRSCQPQLPETTKAMPCHRPAYDAQPHSRFAAPQRPLRSCYFALVFFRLKPGLVAWVLSRGPINPRLGPPGASTFPRIWIRSIGGCKISVKRKTLNVDDFFVLRLYLVVPFLFA